MQERNPDWAWDDLRVFLAAMRTGSLTRAARTLGVNPSTASRRLGALEASLGVRLFDRVRDGLEPTPVARDVLVPAEAAEAAILGFSSTIAGRDSALQGGVRLTVPDAMDSLLVVPALPIFYARYPRITLEVIGSPALLNLARREADLALRFVRPVAGDLVVRRLVTMTTGVWTRADAPDRWILADDGDGAPAEQAWIARHVPDVRAILRVNRMEARVAAVEAGLGRAALPDAAARRIPGLVRVPLPDDPPACELWIVAHRRLYGVPRVRAVWDFLVEVVLRDLGGGGAGTTRETQTPSNR